MTRVWEDQRHGGQELLLLLALADFANDEGFCWPAVQTLAKKVRVSESSIHRALADLETEGSISIYEKGGGRRSNTYCLVGYLREGCQVDTPAPEQDDLTPQGCQVDTPPLSQLCDPTPVTAMTPESSYNHHRTPTEPSVSKEPRKKVESTSRCSDIWNRTMVTLKMELPPDAVFRWLGRSRLLAFDGKEATVEVMNELAVDWCRARWATHVGRALGKVEKGPPLTVQFVAA
jgi:hypothetical protein